MVGYKPRWLGTMGWVQILDSWVQMGWVQILDGWVQTQMVEYKSGKTWVLPSNPQTPVEEITHEKLTSVWSAKSCESCIAGSTGQWNQRLLRRNGPKLKLTNE